MDVGVVPLCVHRGESFLCRPDPLPMASNAVASTVDFAQDLPDL